MYICCLRTVWDLLHFHSCFQIRAVNNFLLFGNWSDPVLILNATDETNAPQASNNRGLWIYVAVGVLSVLLVMLLVGVSACVYWQFCFHRRIKYVGFRTLTCTYSLPPSFPALTLTHSLTHSLTHTLTHSLTHSLTH